jgi:hypothetical protein
MGIKNMAAIESIGMGSRIKEQKDEKGNSRSRKCE